jgi:TonB family protein
MSRDATAQESQEPLSAYEAKFHVGEHATVCGRVESGVYLRHSFRQPTYLNLDGEYPNHLFTIFIRREDRSQFPMPPERQYAAQHVCVTGVIEIGPSMRIRSADAISIRRGLPQRPGPPTDEPPRLIQCPPLRYPEELLQERAAVVDTVVLEVQVKADGTVGATPPRVLRSTHQALEQAALAAIADCRFRPGRVAGKPTALLVKVPFHFSVPRRDPP